MTAPTPLPNFFILGAGRCGTTSLAVALRRHPGVFIPKIKEPSFFASSWQWVKNPVDYARLYREAGAAPAVGDASHLYLEDPDSAPTLRAFFPEARFLLVFRHPTDRALALYSLMIEGGNEWIPTFEGALRAEDRRWASPRFRRRSPHSFWNFMYFRSGLFGEQIERYHEHFPADRFHYTTLGRLIADPDAELGRIQEFLGLERRPFPTFPRDGTSKGVASIALAVFERRLLRPLARRSRGVLEPARHGLVRWNRRHGAKPSMRDATRRRLDAAYAPDLARLAELTGIDLRRTPAAD